MSEKSDEERAESIMPQYIFWGEGIVLIGKEEYYLARNRLVSILGQLRKLKKRAQENRQ